jgi:hypothetical protein
MAAFDVRKTEMPLEEDALIVEFGKSRNDALIVVVVVPKERSRKRMLASFPDYESFKKGKFEVDFHGLLDLNLQKFDFQNLFHMSTKLCFFRIFLKLARFLFPGLEGLENLC